MIASYQKLFRNSNVYENIPRKTLGSKHILHTLSYIIDVISKYINKIIRYAGQPVAEKSSFANKSPQMRALIFFGFTTTLYQFYYLLVSVSI